MKLQQLRFLLAVANHGLNVSAAAAALYTSQPGISRQIRQLEDELGLELFERQGRRLVALTAAGEQVSAHARRVLQEVQGIKQVAEELRRDCRSCKTEKRA